MSLSLRAAALAAVLAGSGAAHASVLSVSAKQPLTAAGISISFGSGASATYIFTPVSAAVTGNGPGAAVATRGTAKVSSFFGSITDFGAGAAIDQNKELYTFTAFPTASVIPNSPADDFIGLSFTLADGIHYGYAEVAGASLVSYGYQTTAGASIRTAAVPEPASLAVLGIAAVGLVASRRRSRATGHTA